MELNSETQREVATQPEQPEDTIEKDQPADKILAEMDQGFKQNTTKLEETDPA